MYVEKRKRSHTPQEPSGRNIKNGVVDESIDLGDSMDHLLISREFVEWTFFAESIFAPIPGKHYGYGHGSYGKGRYGHGGSATGEAETWDFYGQIDFVQFMSAPASMNIGYETGSIETFEYQRNAYRGDNSGTDITRNGIAMPMDTRRP